MHSGKNTICKSIIIVLISGMFFLTAGIGTSKALASDETSIEKRIKILESEIKQLKEETIVRRKLVPTQTEQEADEAEALFAAGREYSMLKKNTLGIEYRFNYSYNSYDIISQVSTVEQQVDHNLTSTIFLEYGLLNNVAVNASLPFVYKYDQLGTKQDKSVTDLGDLSLGVTYQPLKSGGDFPTTLMFGTLTVPSGRSPYEINVNTEIATGSGAWAVTGGASFSKTQDPVVVFGSLFSTYYFPVEDLNQNRSGDTLKKVELGPTISASMGFAFSMSYKVSMNLSSSYTYAFSNDYDWQNNGTTTSGNSTRASFSLGTGWRVSSKTSVNIKLTVGLTSNDPDFSFFCRIPFNFDLSKKKQ
ncbi:MAG: transporter [Desulfobacula sp.]|nr:transporter [Desulfobacula sp.]